ncbi:transposon resolvase [Caballeronia temeraria]|uniref:Transposon resolvase n=2 Tax=Caballeronia temeraria TaxID=1777137 RepID=A0A158BYY4_9BURK|nr:transposon resolvase [Caballeronia temeraria]
MSVYVIVEVATASKKETLEALSANGIPCEENNVCIDEEKCTLPAPERPILQRTLRGLRSGDLLVINSVSSLGNSALDALTTLRSVKKAGATVVCLVYERKDAAPLDDELLMKSLELVAELDHVVRQKRAKEASDAAVRQGLRIGRACSLSFAQQEAVVRALSSGRTVTELARQYGVARQTIIRVRRKWSLKLED